MSGRSYTRKEAIGLGAKYVAGSLVSATFLPGIVSARHLRKSIREFNVLDHGAAGDGQTVDTKAFQMAIDLASESGGGARVLIPGGYKFLVGSIELKSNIDFHLADDAEMIISTRREDYGKDPAVITARDTQGLLISGTGNIDGQSLKFMTHFDKEEEWWRPMEWRPRLFQLYTCNDLEVRDIHFGNAPFWGLHMIGCENVMVDNITVRNHLDLPNCDGINPDHCRNVEIKNCDIRCGDDAIVIKATRQDQDYGPSAHIHVHDCILETQDSAVKIGTETTQDIHDIVFERCEVSQCCRGCTIQLRDEGSVFNVEFRDINFRSRYFSRPWWGRGEAISFTAIPRTHDTVIGEIHDIKVSNVNAETENSIRINGTPEGRIRDIHLDNVHIKMNRHTRYPGGLFDNRPTETYPDIEIHDNPGFSIRYADEVRLNNCSVTWGPNRPAYYTHALKAENVSGLKLNKFEGESAHPDSYDAIAVH